MKYGTDENGEMTVILTKQELTNILAKANSAMLDRDFKQFEDNGEKMDPAFIVLQTLITAHFSAEILKLVFKATEESTETEVK